MPDSRWLDPMAAAEYLRVRTDALSKLVRQGRIPAPDYRLGPRRPRWTQEMLDGVPPPAQGSTDPRIATQAAIEKIRTQGRSRRSPAARGRNDPGISVSTIPGSGAGSPGD